MREIGTYCPFGSRHVELYEDADYDGHCSGKGWTLLADDGNRHDQPRYMVGYRHDDRCHRDGPCHPADQCQPGQVTLLQDLADEDWCPPPQRRVYLDIDPHDKDLDAAALPVGSWVGDRAAAVDEVIDDFDGPYKFLSNFYRAPLRLDDTEFATAEAAFQARKTVDPSQRAAIAATADPFEAKRLGGVATKIPHWDERDRYRAMRDVLAAKFSDPALAQRLIATGTALLVEGNGHHDWHWGSCTCPRHKATPGYNYLGRFLMQQRRRLTPALGDRWVRVACIGSFPDLLAPGSQNWLESEVLPRIAARLRKEYGMDVALSGGEVGTDLLWAEATHQAGARTWVYALHPRQDGPWDHAWKTRRARVLARCSRVATLGDQYRTTTLNWRNNWMLRDADSLVVIVDDPLQTDLGTLDAIRKARGRLPLIYVDAANRRTTINDPTSTLRRQPDPA